MTEPLDEWVEKNCPELREQVETHVEALTDLDEEFAESLVRCIFTSIRQSLEEEFERSRKIEAAYVLSTEYFDMGHIRPDVLRPYWKYYFKVNNNIKLDLKAARTILGDDRS